MKQSPPLEGAQGEDWIGLQNMISATAVTMPDHVPNANRKDLNQMMTHP